MAVCGIARKGMVNTLQQICFYEVAKIFDVLIACSSQEEISFLLIKSEEFLKTFRNVKEDKTTHCASLESTLFCINHNLKTLYSWWIKPSYIPAVIVKLKTVESTLINLRVTSAVALDELFQLFCVLPKTLRRLSLSNRNCTDDMLQIVAKRCPQLETLQLEFCEQISDSGVKALCYENEKGDVCPNVSLRVLHLNGTKVTEAGLTFALENFPNLQVIRHPNFCEVIDDIFETSKDRLLQTNLRNFKTLDFEHCSCSGLKILSVFCPYVMELWVRLHTQEELDICAEFVSLKNVHFWFKKPCNVLPFLEVRGKTLEALEIYGSSEFPLSLESLVKLCPELQDLQLTKPKFEKIKQFGNRDSKYILFQLNDLSIVDANIDNLKECLMFLIDQSRNLKGLMLLNSPSLFSVAFERVVFNCSYNLNLDALGMTEVEGDLIKLNKTLSNSGFRYVNCRPK